MYIWYNMIKKYLIVKLSLFVIALKLCSVNRVSNWPNVNEDT